MCDTNQVARQEESQGMGCGEGLYRLPTLLEDKDVDLVELLTPHHLHCPMTIQAAQAGKHVSVQKPMALSAHEADEMICSSREGRCDVEGLRDILFITHRRSVPTR